MNLRTVHSEVDAGVTLDDDRCPLCKLRHRMAVPIGPERILVAEDEPSVASLIAYNLEQDGYRVSIAADGEEAIPRSSRSPPDLLVLDLLLPLRSGWQVLRQIRSEHGAEARQVARPRGQRARLRSTRAAALRDGSPGRDRQARFR